MKQVLIFILVAILVYHISSQNQIYLPDSQISTTYVNDLSDNIKSNILSILINGTVNFLGNCTTDRKANQVQYWLSTRTIRNGEPLTFNTTEWNRRTMILLHGWLGNRNSNYITTMRKALLKRYAANVIVVDYGYYVAGDYLSAYCNLFRVVKNFARFLCTLNRYRALSRIHVIGHSMGAQLAGISGHLIKRQCGILGRITALDPAGPLYQDINTEQRLDWSDAIFVQSIHTNQGIFGYKGNVGHIDFYANCGTFQPGCWQTVAQNITLDNIINLPINYIVCNHQRSCNVFAESVTQNSFLATAIFGPFLCIEDDMDGIDRTYMGQYCRSPGEHPSYNFLTRATSPYGLGPDGPLR